MSAQFKALIILAVILTIGGMAFYLIQTEDNKTPLLEDSSTFGNSVSDGKDTPDKTEVSDLADSRSTSVRLIKFPDGESLEFRVNAAPTHPVAPSGPIIEHYGSLVQRANAGDSDAALLLYNVLGHCGTVYRTKEELEKAIDQLHQTHTLPTENPNDPAEIVGTENMATIEKSLRDSYSRCRGLSDRQIDEAKDWLTTAADAGNTYAMKVLGQQLLREDPSRALYYLESAWLSGDLDVVSQLAYFYSNAPSEKVDIITGNAYRYLHYRITEEMIAAGGEISGPPRSKESYTHADSLLMPRELNQSLDAAKEILKQNPNCCFSRRIRH